jgi:hypothetical protein
MKKSKVNQQKIKEWLDKHEPEYKLMIDMVAKKINGFAFTINKHGDFFIGDERISDTAIKLIIKNDCAHYLQSIDTTKCKEIIIERIWSAVKKYMVINFEELKNENE